MKKLTLIAGLASVVTVAAVLWSLPVTAIADDDGPTRSVPEPGTLALLGLGLVALGVRSLRRRSGE